MVFSEAAEIMPLLSAEQITDGCTGYRAKCSSTIKLIISILFSAWACSSRGQGTPIWAAPLQLLHSLLF